MLCLLGSLHQFYQQLFLPNQLKRKAEKEAEEARKKKKGKEKAPTLDQVIQNLDKLIVAEELSRLEAIASGREKLNSLRNNQLVIDEKSLPQPVPGTEWSLEQLLRFYHVPYIPLQQAIERTIQQVLKDLPEGEARAIAVANLEKRYRVPELR